MTPGSRSRACLALVRAFCPGEASCLRECRSSECGSLVFPSERVTIEFDLPTEACRKRAFELTEDRSGPEQLALPGAVLADWSGQVRGGVLTVKALVVVDQ